jgi:hypothetical protein
MLKCILKNVQNYAIKKYIANCIFSVKTILSFFYVTFK